MVCIGLWLARINTVVIIRATQDHIFTSQGSKNRLKKRVYRNYGFLFPWDLKKSVLGSSIYHYSLNL